MRVLFLSRVPFANTKSVFVFDVQLLEDIVLSNGQKNTSVAYPSFLSRFNASYSVRAVNFAVESGFSPDDHTWVS